MTDSEELAATLGLLTVDGMFCALPLTARKVFIVCGDAVVDEMLWTVLTTLANRKELVAVLRLLTADGLFCAPPLTARKDLVTVSGLAVVDGLS